MPTEPRTVRFNRQTFKVLGDRRIRGEDYLVVGHYGNGERSREHVLQVLGKHRHKEKVIHCLKNSKDNWRRINHLDRIQGSHLPFAGITSIGKSGNELFVVMEHIRGKSLRHNLRMEKRLTAYQAIRLYSQLVRQLCNLYRTTGIIHGDIAPENLIVSPQGTRLVLIDFGSSFRKGKVMRKETELKQQAMLIKAAFEEGWREAHNRDECQHPELMWDDWHNSTAKVIYDQLLMQAKGNVNVQTNVGNG